MKYLFWRIRTEWNLIQRRRWRKAKSRAGTQSWFKSIHNRFARDRLVRERMA